MGRRKRILDDGDDSDSNDNSDDLDFDLENDADAREERALFENPYRNKRKRTNGKEDALYGIFAENSDEEDGPRRGKASRAKKSDWAKAPAFVTGDKPAKLEESMAVDSDNAKDEGSDGNSFEEEDADGEDDGSEGENEPREDAEYSDDSEPSRAPSPRVRIEDEGDEESQPIHRVGGIGSAATHTHEVPSFSAAGGIGSSRLDQQSSGFSRGGIGSKSSKSFPTAQEPSPSLPTSTFSTPSAFAGRSQSFTRAANDSPKPVALPTAELAHFSKLQGSFGARMLSKMGWQAGTGLGTTGDGIVIPIESKLRPQKMGIAFKGFKEKTEQSKLEAKRRGEVVSDEEDEKTKKFRKKAKEQQEKRSDAWKRPKKVKTKTEHKTYEQILAEAGEPASVSGIGQIIDATEVRHNIKLITDACKSDLDGLAREARALQERKKFVVSEDVRLRKKVEEEAGMITRLRQIQQVANDINATARELASVYEVSLEPFSPSIQKLINEYATEYDRYRLDEVVVAAIAPVMRRMVLKWDPLEDPALFLSTFRSWRRALKINEEEPPDTQIDMYGSKTTVARPSQAEKSMTPFESLLWNIWLPKVRTSINNDWLPDSPQPAVRFYEVWSSFLPPFIHDNLLDQLILPKIQKAVMDWNARHANVSLQAIVFPWLPHVGLRFEDVMGDAKRKVKNLLRSWTVDQPIPADLAAWKDIFDLAEWDAMLLKYVVPKLGATLRNDFRVNPRDQKMESLQRVLVWANIIRPTIFSQILETEFFPKWLDVLHIWLIQPRVSFEEVAQWYSFWKETFPEDVRSLPGVNRGFMRGLQLMNKAIEFGPDAPTKLAKPDFRGELSEPSSPARAKIDEKFARPSARTHEITFRSIVEEYAASHNLLFIPTGKAHERSRMPLFRVSRTTDGRKGLLVYILDDAVWAPKGDEINPESGEFKAISLEDMVLRSS
ncbi:hypothetical protein M413DRAFT_442564 [Hebeloma cylindrosporum]|uniref:G-patch domain-containing protein n=1 Tax=Hebeloma cylindrosporum TaxID=76867 RepID=A0A0C3CKI5_HEBCY|nr:hypothetical protein M413DRAFT_442564 [Hebeloma cylindrosporum h7]